MLKVTERPSELSGIERASLPFAGPLCGIAGQPQSLSPNEGPDDWHARFGRQPYVSRREATNQRVAFLSVRLVTQ